MTQNTNSEKYNTKLFYSILTFFLITFFLFIYGFYKSYNEVDDDNNKIYTTTQSFLRGISFAFIIICIILLIMATGAFMFSTDVTTVFLFGGAFLQIVGEIFSALAGNL